jgi:hypothetical protein
MIADRIFTRFDIPDSGKRDVLRGNTTFFTIGKNNTLVSKNRIKRDGFIFYVSGFQDYGLVAVQFRIAYSTTPLPIVALSTANKYLFVFLLIPDLHNQRYSLSYI